MKEKHCKSCKQTLPIYRFTKSKMVKDGYENKCKKCRQEARKRYANICDVCGSEFKTATKSSGFCSVECQGIARRKRVAKDCSYCNDEIEVRLSLADKHEHYYCNQNCRTKHLKILMIGEHNPNYNRLNYSCDGCGKGIKVIPSKLKSQKYIFCSNECYKSNIGKHFTGDDNPNFVEEIQLKCDHCGKWMSRKPGEVNNNGKNYCSKACHIRHQFVPTGITYHTHECKQCGAMYKTVKKNSTFCSTECLNENNSERFRGVNHPRYNPELTDEEREINRKYPEYHEWRSAVYKRDSYTCQCCGNDEGGNLIAHHIYNYSERKELRTDVNNGITLCKTCHKNFHDNYGYTKNNVEQLNDFITDYRKAPIPQ